VRIAVLGSGNVGMSIANGFADAGHDVVIGTRNADKPELDSWLRQGRSALDYRGATDAAELVVLAVPGRLVREIVEQIGPGAFDSKIVVDATNPILHVGDSVEPAYGENSSATEEVQKALPGARVIKGFNEILAPRMMSPDTSKGPAHMRIAGDDADAKRVFAELMEPFGWTIDDLGGVEQARLLEQKTLNWMRRPRT